MEYKGHSIELTTNADKSGKVRDVFYAVRRAGESTIVFSGVIAGDFASDVNALAKARKWIDENVD